MIICFASFFSVLAHDCFKFPVMYQTDEVYRIASYIVSGVDFYCRVGNYLKSCIIARKSQGFEHGTGPEFQL